METRATDETWPTKKSRRNTIRAIHLLSNFVPEKWGYSKHAIMGPAGKLLGIVAASKFGKMWIHTSGT